LGKCGATQQQSQAEQKGPNPVIQKQLFACRSTPKSRMFRTVLHDSFKNLGASYGNFNNFLLVSLQSFCKFYHYSNPLFKT
jgi:hypothetical protein